ncbi:MAG TPA: DUF1653 domain-containing protein [Oceanicaulis sp.]|nr:DUF1653 domain-containing protein [Oceanicaulis sp.]
MTDTTVKPGIYRHYKGGCYTVLSVGVHTETAERFVVYRSDETGEVWLRPLNMFIETVISDTGPTRRFRKASDCLVGGSKQAERVPA